MNGKSKSADFTRNFEAIGTEKRIELYASIFIRIYRISVTFISDLEWGEPTAEIEKIIRITDAAKK